MSDETYTFFCRPLNESITFAGHYTSILSMIGCAYAFAVFFKQSTVDDTISKTVAFLVACFAIFYIFASRYLIRGIKEEQKSKFICWIVMSVITVIFSVVFDILKMVLFLKEKSYDSAFLIYALLGTTALCVILNGILVYCIWGVVTLYRVLGRNDSQGGVV